MKRYNWILIRIGLFGLVCFLFGCLITLAFVNTELNVENVIDSGYKFVVSINDTNNLTLEQFEELAYQWVHYFDNQIFNITDSGHEFTIKNFKIENK